MTDQRNEADDRAARFYEPKRTLGAEEHNEEPEVEGHKYCGPERALGEADRAMRAADKSE